MQSGFGAGTPANHQVYGMRVIRQLELLAGDCSSERDLSFLICKAMSSLKLTERLRAITT